MSFFKEVYNKVFGGEGSSSKVVHQEVLVRSDSFLSDYSHWKNSYQREDLVRSIADSFELKKRKIVGEPDVHILKTPTSSGFAISCGEVIDVTESQYLLEYFKDKTLSLDYKRANADITYSEKANFIETVEKYYLKPQIAASSGPFDQQFGNVLIEFTQTDGKAVYIKVLANTYSDRNYKKGLLFDDLAELLLRI